MKSGKNLRSLKAADIDKMNLKNDDLSDSEAASAVRRETL